jgi:hypothetical protein
MQRKQQVGECWVCVIFFACACVGASDMTTASDDPSSSGFCVMCTRIFPRGVLGGGGAGMPPFGYTKCLATSGSPGQRPEIFFFWWFLLLLADFAIFSGFLN